MKSTKSNISPTFKNVKHTVMTPVAALTPASPNAAVAASVTRAVAAILTTLRKTKQAKMRKRITLKL